MNYSTDNTRIIDKVDLVTPNDVISKYPLTDEISKLVYGTRNEVSQIPVSYTHLTLPTKRIV